MFNGIRIELGYIYNILRALLTFSYLKYDFMKRNSLKYVFAII